MTEPTSQLEYEVRYAKNQRIEGYGIEGVRIHVPCPFCAASDFIVHKIMDTEAAHARGAVCRECNRGCRMVATAVSGGKAFRFVQTIGPTAPRWVAALFTREEAS